MTSQSSSKTIVIRILPNVSQSKGNQKMKFDQLIEYNKRNDLLQKVIQKMRLKDQSQTSLFS